MKKSEINFTIELNDQKIPEKIRWSASDMEGNVPDESKAISLSIWDQASQNTLRIDLWTKDMPVHEMKRFYIDCIGGLAQSLLSATGDEFMTQEMNGLCDKLVEHVKEEESKQ